MKLKYVVNIDRINFKLIMTLKVDNINIGICTIIFYVL